MIRTIITEIAATPWRAWLATAFEFAGVAIIVAAIAMIAIGFAPH